MTQFGKWFVSRKWLVAAAAALTLVLQQAQGRGATQDTSAHQNAEMFQFYGSYRNPHSDLQSVRSALQERKITVSFSDVPLRYAVEAIKEYLGNISLTIDDVMIADAGIDMTQLVNVSATDADAQSFLTDLLKPAGLAYAVVDNSIVVTTSDCARCQECSHATTASATSCAVASTMLKPISHAFSFFVAIANPNKGQTAAQPNVPCCPQGVCTGVGTASPFTVIKLQDSCPQGVCTGPSTTPCYPHQCPTCTRPESCTTGCCPACKDCCPLCRECPVHALVKPVSNITIVFDTHATGTCETSVDRKLSVSITNVDLKSVLELVREVATVSGVAEARPCHAPIVFTTQPSFKFISGITPSGCFTPSLQVQCQPCPTCPAAPVAITRPATCTPDPEILPMPRASGDDDGRTNLERQNEELRRLCTEQERAIHEMQALMREFSREVTTLRRDMLLIRFNQAATHIQQPIFDGLQPDHNPWSPGPANTHFVPGAALWGSPMVPISVYPR
jgi:hypothetical protein